MEQTIQQLVLVYGGVLLINLALSAMLWFRYRTALHRDQFRLCELPKIPARESEAAQGPGIGMRPLAYLTDESPQTGQVWDLGTYEIVEGSLDRARASIYFSGQRMSGPWRLAREGDTWNLTNLGGSLTPGLPKTRSMLSRFLPTQRGTRNHAA